MIRILINLKPYVGATLFAETATLGGGRGGGA